MAKLTFSAFVMAFLIACSMTVSAAQKKTKGDAAGSAAASLFDPPY